MSARLSNPNTARATSRIPSPAASCELGLERGRVVPRYLRLDYLKHRDTEPNTFRFDDRDTLARGVALDLVLRQLTHSEVF